LSSTSVRSIGPLSPVCRSGKAAKSNAARGKAANC